MKHTFLQLFGLAARDKSPEEIAKLAMDTADAMEEEEKKEPAGDPKNEPTKDEPYKEKLYESIDDEALDGLVEKIMAKMAAKKAAEEGMEDKDPIEATIEQLTAHAAQWGPILSGLPEAPLQHITLRQLQVESRSGLVARYLSGKLEHCMLCAEGALGPDCQLVIAQ